MSIKITEGHNNALLTAPSSEDSELPEKIKEKLKEKTPPLPESVSGLIGQLLLQTDKNMPISGGGYSREVQKYHSSPDGQPAELAFSLIDKRALLSEKKTDKGSLLVFNNGSQINEVGGLKSASNNMGNQTLYKKVHINGVSKADEQGEHVSTTAAMEWQNKRNLSSEMSAPQHQLSIKSDGALSDGQSTNFTGSTRPATAAMMQNHMRLQATEASVASSSIDVDYKFQQWPGEHSVKVTVPVDLARDGNVTLLPSGSRVADALSNQFSHLSIPNAKLLEPLRDGEEQRQRQPQQDTSDEEQE
ncbi:hypothetical protein LU604_00485 [Erwinia tracheiphila]|uniref:Surface presentation of antigen domain-containing protein n=1 Tax=Erwinia tracheiphila TaxID=65700 RepID=A0A345CW22_9GAMM|nr:hypothetical protein [Erwinia tracheiphila]AXF77639.1 hypothetical protein AV903_18865 [Erwinia tracheiphila]UIA83674.1 hypothetical protein LU604_00485 [Erwinia tracheiphila]UIA92256.1 hypothetical protein LU632_00480 [Erwinia tracheiphila]